MAKRAKSMNVLKFEDVPCLTKLKGADRKLYECVIECIEQRTNRGALQGRLILFFEDKGPLKPMRARKSR